MEKLADAADCFSDLKVLHLGAIKSEDAILHIIKMINGLTNLQSLTFQNEYIYGSRGIDITPNLSEMLRHSKKLEFLRIDFCKKMDLSLATPCFKNLKNLELRYLDAKSVSLLADVALELPKVNCLTLYKSDLKNTSDLISIIKNMPSLKKLYLKSRNIDIENFDKLIVHLGSIKNLGIYESVYNTLYIMKDSLPNLYLLRIYYEQKSNYIYLWTSKMELHKYLDSFSNI